MSDIIRCVSPVCKAGRAGELRHRFLSQKGRKSGLLTAAGLVVTPTATDTGKSGRVKGVTGNGDDDYRGLYQLRGV